RAVSTLTRELIFEMLFVALIIFIFLRNARSALIPVLTLPAAVLMSFIFLKLFGVSAIIMFLGGFVIAFAALVDAEIVVIENCHKKLEESTPKSHDERLKVILEAIKEVAPSSFFSILVIAVSFFPVFVLEAQEGRLFKPLAYTKTLAMLLAALLSITLV